MAWSDRDLELGMDRPISRRDFLNGVAMGVTAAAISGLPLPVTAATPSGDPSKLSGLGGHSEAAMNIMHAIRDGDFWNSAPAIEPTGETYDLVVVGGGISGLAAAHLFRQQKPDAKILILENNQTFGGHAVRNEFIAKNGKRVVGYGGSQSLQTPSFFSPLVSEVMADIGIEPARFEDWYDGDWWDRLGVPSDSQFYGAELFGTDKLVLVDEEDSSWIDQTPLNGKAKADLKRITDEAGDYLPGKSREEKRAALAAMTYAAFLTGPCGCDIQVPLAFAPDEYLATTADCYSALDAWAVGLPGFAGMDLGDAPDPANMPSARLLATDPDDYIYHFPDGNASLARALVRKLIPAALPGSSIEDLVTADIDFAALDVAANPVRLRLASSVVKVAHDGDLASATRVNLTYVEEGKLKTVTGGHAILACWHRVIPHITDELPEAQVVALNDQVKTPLVYANVLISNFEAFAKLGISGFWAVPGFWSGVALDDPVSIGDYQCPQSPSEPIVLHVWSIPGTGDGSSARDQSTAGRHQLTSLSFEDYERGLPDLLQRALGPGGFDAARDIEAITVNRWSHGYSLEYMRPWDAYWPQGPLPIEAARKGWGRIAIANADSGAYAYAHSAIDQAGRAVNELVGGIKGFSTFPGPPLDALGLDD